MMICMNNAYRTTLSLVYHAFPQPESWCYQSYHCRDAMTRVALDHE